MIINSSEKNIREIGSRKKTLAKKKLLHLFYRSMNFNLIDYKLYFIIATDNADLRFLGELDNSGQGDHLLRLKQTVDGCMQCMRTVRFMIIGLPKGYHYQGNKKGLLFVWLYSLRASSLPHPLPPN